MTSKSFDIFELLGDGHKGSVLSPSKEPRFALIHHNGTPFYSAEIVKGVTTIRLERVGDLVYESHTWRPE